MSARWRAQLLPADGGGLVSPAQMREIAAAHGRAFGFVPFFIAGKPTSDPQYAYGHVTGVEAVADGLDVILVVSDLGSGMLRRDKELPGLPRLPAER